MAKQVKVFSDDITNIGKEIEKLLESINQNYSDMEKNKALIADTWQSEAAMKLVNNITKETKNLKSAIDGVKEAKKYVDDTSKKIREADNDIKKKISSII
ncbi:MAG: hypothetical protein J1E81_00485 [Eubacterium sp.]|nr:hypothetical protein [Eubacterium sp.]